MKHFTIASLFIVFAAIGIVFNCGRSIASGIREGGRTYDIGICTDKGMVNPVNEDTCGMFAVGRDVVCAVCDGVGGAAAGCPVTTRSESYFLLILPAFYKYFCSFFPGRIDTSFSLHYN